MYTQVFIGGPKKKQEPPPKERLRALLVKQSGVMMTKVLPVASVVFKLVS
jgi:hypothetical protein